MLFKIHKLFLLIKNTRLFAAWIKHQVAASVEHYCVLKKKDFLTIIDIGANRGQFSLAAKKFNPKAKIISFEPLSQPAKIFRKIFHGDPLVVLHESAIGPLKAEATIHISSKDDSSSLLAISPLQSDIFPGTQEVATSIVDIGPLDNFIDGKIIVGPALLKLDVQGYEYEALAGCETLLSNFDYVYCECSFLELYEKQKMASDVISWMASKNFVLDGVFNTSYDSNGNPVQADFLFRRS